MKILRNISSFVLILMLLICSFFVGVFEGFSYASYGSIKVGKWTGTGYKYQDGILILYLFVVIVLLVYFLSKYIKKDFYRKMLIFTSLILSLLIFIGLISTKFTIIQKIAEFQISVKNAQPNLVKYIALIEQTIIIDWVLFSLILLTTFFELIQYFISKKKDKNIGNLDIYN